MQPHYFAHLYSFGLVRVELHFPADDAPCLIAFAGTSAAETAALHLFTAQFEATGLDSDIEIDDEVMYFIGDASPRHIASRVRDAAAALGYLRGDGCE